MSSVPAPHQFPDDSVPTELWCVVDDDAAGTPFTILLPGNINTLGIKTLIKREKSKAFEHVDTSDLILWKLNVAEPVDPDDTLLHRIHQRGKDLTKFATKMSAAEKVLLHFSQSLVDHLHIFVQVPKAADEHPARLAAEEMGRAAKKPRIDSYIVDDGPRYVNFGFRQLHYDGSPSDYYLRFYKQFWGVPLPQEHISLKDSVPNPDDEENDENGGENDADLLPLTPPPILDLPWTKLLIRAEYLRVYKWVEDMYEVGNIYRPSAIIITGQPGIGKTFWAYYALRRRLGEKSVSMWFQGSQLYLFCSEGVLIVPASFTFNKFNPRMWTIIDSAQSPSGIPSDMTHFPPGVFPIYITSPQPARWSGITQSWTSRRVIMNPWTRAEIQYAIGIRPSNLEPNDVLQRYDQLGPTARFCFELSPDEVACHISDRDESIRRTDPGLLRAVFSNGAQLSLDTFSHKICLIQRIRGDPLGYGRFTTDLISAAVEQLVAQRLEHFSEDQLLDMWSNFSKFGDARGMTGSIFEAFVHRHFRTRIDLDATPMVRSNRANSRWHASFSTTRPQTATVHGVALQVFSLQVDVGSTFIYDTANLNIQPDVYYLPRSGQPVAFDSFILSGGHLYVFQCTGGRDHSMKDGLVDFLASCGGLPPRTNWHFVFVIPDDLVSFSCPASSHSIIKDLGLYVARIPMSRA